MLQHFGYNLFMIVSFSRLIGTWKNVTGSDGFSDSFTAFYHRWSLILSGETEHIGPRVSGASKRVSNIPGSIKDSPPSVVASPDLLKSKFVL